MTQKELIKAYVQEFGFIVPAKMAGHVYRGVMFGSETSKRCRELREAGVLTSSADGKFERFVLTSQPLPVAFRPLPQAHQGAMFQDGIYY